MLFEAAHFFLALILELLLMRTMCKVLPMRTVLGYCVADFCYYCLSMATQGKILGFPRVAFILIHFMLPVIFSTGPLPNRLVRVAAVFTVELLAEPIAVVSWWGMTGEATMAPTVTDSTFLPMLTVYGILILVIATLFEMLIAFFQHIDHEGTASVELPVIAEMALSPLFFHVINTKLYIQDSLTPVSVAGILAFVILSSVLCVAMLDVANRDIKAKRKLVDHAAFIRQATHSRREVEAIARRASSVRRLRHDLANQMTVVERLIASGQAAEADRYLQALQAQSKDLLER